MLVVTFAIVLCALSFSAAAIWLTGLRCNFSLLLTAKIMVVKFIVALSLFVAAIWLIGNGRSIPPYKIGSFDKPIYNSYYMIQSNTRHEIGDILETFKFKIGVELGVQSGGYSEVILKKWKSCQKYYLVDIWKKQDNYKDGSNVDQKAQDFLMEGERNRLNPWKNITVFYRMSTVEAVNKFVDQSLDFVYIDARHYYCAVMEDIENYWPKVTPGGILAGHDYTSPPLTADNDYRICKNGSKVDGSVKRAVDEFVIKEQFVLSVTYGEGMWNSWLVRKPFH